MTNDVAPLWGDVKAPTWQPNRTAWLLTCVDLTSLLVGFFVLLFSMQTLQSDKWQALTASFQDQFAPNALAGTQVSQVAPDGTDNAVVRVTGVKSGLGYLDSLLHQRLEDDPVWRGLVMENGQGDGVQDVHYVVPDAAMAQEAWVRLAGAVRGWKNPVGVRVQAVKGQELAAAQTAARLAGVLAGQGVGGVFAEVQQGPVGRVELVVRAR